MDNVQLERIANALERIAEAMENKERRDVNESKKRLKTERESKG